ncbi:hypothetical protein LXA43DRAFT_1097527 [Ganoderma leucocontextum]|nr:hypothetical protein LXA43DRAFT_1097527 [Ganoderma leucocontextum]
MIDSLYPHEFQKLEHDDLLFRVARQRILNWWRAFYEHAVKVVKAGYEEFKLKHRNTTKADIKKWAAKALDPDIGFAFWESPPTREDPTAHGNLQSIYILTTFAPHIAATANSHYEECQPPIGALSMALTAVDFSFSVYTTGEYVPPKDKFDQEGVGHISDWHLKDAVLPALKKHDQWSVFMERATQFSLDESWIALPPVPTRNSLSCSNCL